MPIRSILRHALVCAVILSQWAGTILYGQVVCAVQSAAATQPPTNGLYLWYDASCITYAGGCSTPTNGSNVSSWYDRSGNGNNMSVAAGTTPTYQTNAINSLPAVVFTNCRCSFASLAAASGYTGFVVMKKTASGRGDLISSSSTSSFTWWFSTTQGVDVTNIVQVGTGTATIGTTAFHQSNVTFANNSSNVNFRFDRATDATVGATSGNATTANNIFGDHGVSDASLLNANVAEFLFYRRVLSSTEIETIETYLFNKYAI